MSGQIHADFLRLLWVLADKQMRSYYESMGKEDNIGNDAFRWARAKAFNSYKTSIGRAIAFGCATRCHLSVNSLVLPRPGSGDDSRGGGTWTGAPGGGSRGGRHYTSGDANLSEGRGDSMSAPSFAVSAGHGVDVACLNAFLAFALQRVVREAVFVQGPASASVVPSAGVRVVVTGVSGGIAASVAGRVGELAAVCRERVVVGAASRRSSAGGAVSCQVMSPGLSSVVSSTLVEGAPGATNITRPALVPSPLHFHTPTKKASEDLDSCELDVFRSHCFFLLLLKLIFNKHPQIKKEKVGFAM